MQSAQRSRIKRLEERLREWEGRVKWIKQQQPPMVRDERTEEERLAGMVQALWDMGILQSEASRRCKPDPAAPKITNG